MNKFPIDLDPNTETFLCAWNGHIKWSSTQKKVFMKDIRTQTFTITRRSSIQCKVNKPTHSKII